LNKKLINLAKKIKEISLTEIFAENKNRFKKFSITIDGMLFDYSKQKITDEVKKALLDFAKEKHLKQKIKDLFLGKYRNISEDRIVYHTALRAINKTPQIQKELDKMLIFSEKIRLGKWRGVSGERITDVINIGVGGSDLGPKMVCKALNHLDDNLIKTHFVSSIDGEQIQKIISTLNPKTSLFIISSKSWTTSDTMVNFAIAKEWILKIRTNFDNKSIIKQHFVAVTANVKLAKEDIAEDNIFEFWDFIGGRFSLFSAIGLPIALQFGMDVFDELLVGANKMDTHFQSEEFDNNIPVLMALIEIWNTNFLDISNRAILPYSASFSELSAYLSQLEMESLGKSVDNQGNRINYHTGSIIFGEVGSNAQHAFYQLFHQGTRQISMDFIALVNGVRDSKLNKLSLINCLAQSQVFAFGAKDKNILKTYQGDKPSNTILLEKLSAKNLGMLISLYEHKVFTQSVLWNINAFDQWGVELGKTIAKNIAENKIAQTDCSTTGLLDFVNRYKQD